MSAPGGARDRSFPGFVATQFLGAFNDNLFKQLVLLLAVDRVKAGGPSLDALATALFALPFVLFSGLAGQLADRYGKRRVIVACKLAEIAVMALAAIGFALRSLELLLAVVFLMGTHSAFFGPSKYGAIPEIVPSREMARANGIVQMTTFLAVILGNAAAGGLKSAFGAVLLAPAAACMLIAVLGTLTSLWIRPLPAQRPELRLSRQPFADLFPTLLGLLRDRSWRAALLAYSFFWFMGVVVQQSMNRYGKILIGLDDEGTSWLLVTLSLGMAAGSVLGGYLARGRIRFGLSRVGALGMIACLIALGFAHVYVPLLHAVLFSLGASGALFGLPFVIWIQSAAPPNERGRLIAVSNFTNWIFIFLGAGYFAAASALLSTAWVPVSLGLLTLIVLPAWLRAFARLERPATSTV
jgi:acyl-[acyl-carrier-protein]-phospholipid O-acyltransferase/long-chain-fatty-acid--[acyl-carrier-protein] ligase